MAHLFEWWDHFIEMPFGSWRDNYHSARLAQILVNVYRDPHAPAAQLNDFFYQGPEAQRRARVAAEQQTLQWFEGKVSDG